MCAQNHMYMTPSTQCVYSATCTLHHLYNVYTIPHVDSIACMTCMQHHMYTVPHARHVHNTSYTQCHLYKMYTTPHAHNTTCTIMYTTPYVRSTTCTTCMQHHMYITLHIQHVHSIIYTQNCISNTHRAPYAYNTAYPSCT